MNKTDVIFEHWRMFAKMMKGQPQGKYFERKLRDGHPVDVLALSKVFTRKEIRRIKDYVRPEQKMCFKNAHLLTMLFPDRVKYVEGEVTILNGGLGVDHAWNLVDNTYYVDVTFELALKQDVTKECYVKLGAYDVMTVLQVTNRTGYYGGIYNQLYLDELKKK